MDTARFVESLHPGPERVSTVICEYEGAQASACALGAEMACALAKAELARRLETHSGKAKK